MRDVTIGIVGLGPSVGRGRAGDGVRVPVVVTRRRRGGGAPRWSRRRVLPGLPDARPAAPPDQLPELLAESDFVVLAAPLTPDTHGLFGRAIAQMKPGHGHQRCARRARRRARAGAGAAAGRLGGAVLDTFREEPLPPASPLFDPPNVILTPHTSWSIRRVLDRLSSCSARTCAGTRTDGRCSTWLTRTRDMTRCRTGVPRRDITPCRSRSSVSPVAARPPSSTR